MNLSIMRMAATACSFSLLAACSGDPVRTSVETYFTDMESIATELSEVGTQFETLMDIQSDISAWTSAEKTEIAEVDAIMARLQTSIGTISVPDMLQDVHPLLIAALADMRASVAIVVEMSNDPSAITEEAADEMMAKAESSEKLADEYLEKLEATVSAAYPDMMQE